MQDNEIVNNLTETFNNIIRGVKYENELRIVTSQLPLTPEEIEEATSLYNTGKVDINSDRSSRIGGRENMLYASLYNDISRTKLLLELGADVNILDFHYTIMQNLAHQYPYYAYNEKEDYTEKEEEERV